MTSPEPTAGGLSTGLNDTDPPAAALRRRSLWRRFLDVWDRQLADAEDAEATTW